MSISMVSICVNLVKNFWYTNITYRSDILDMNWYGRVIKMIFLHVGHIDMHVGWIWVDVNRF